MNWHIEVIAAKLAALAQGKIQQLIINLPPRHLKSLLASIALPAWCLGHDPRPRCRASAMPRITPAALASGRRKHPLAIAKSTGCRGALLTHRWRGMDSNLYGAFSVKSCF
jgi:hypothetical protein